MLFLKDELSLGYKKDHPSFTKVKTGDHLHIRKLFDQQMLAVTEALSHLFGNRT